MTAWEDYLLRGYRFQQYLNSRVRKPSEIKVAIKKKGSRPIVVDGQKYRWRIRSTPTYCQGNGWSNMIVSVTLFHKTGAVLVIDCGHTRPDAWLDASENTSVTPHKIAQHIREAIADGWRPTEPGKPLHLHTR